MIIGIIGIGVVGKAVKRAIENKFEVICYDIAGEFAKEENLQRIVDETEIIFVCAPSPTIDGKQDPSAIVNIFTELTTRAYKGIVCLKSTVLPGTTDKLANFYNLRVVHNPEFLTAAKSYEDFMNQKAVILSGFKFDTIMMTDFYNQLLPGVKILTYPDFKTTEMAKYFSNTFLAVKVTFVNEIYELCQTVKCDYDKVREATLSQGLVAPNHTLVPGPDGKFGYGLGCLPKETTALIAFCNELNLKQEVLNAANEGNKRRRYFDNKCIEVGKKELVI